jgi:hypothetical protein
LDQRKLLSKNSKAKMLLHELVFRLWDGYMTKAMKQIIFFALAIVGCGCVAQGTQSSTSPQPALSIALSTPARSIPIASRIEIRITAQNISGKDIP